MELLQLISSTIDTGDFNTAEKLCSELLSKIEGHIEKTDTHYRLYFNLAGFYTDIGHMASRIDLSKLGLKMLLDHQDAFLKIIPASNYFYSLANAKSNLVKVQNPFDLSFENIEDLVEVKNYYWKALKNKQKNVEESLEYLVNLANALKRQFRISEALRCYDIVNASGKDIPQAQVNRCETLMMLNIVSGSYSVKMFQEIIDGYQKASISNCIPISWSEHYKKCASQHQTRLNELGFNISNTDQEATENEYNALSDYRKFCIQEHLTLSEHGLYCACAGSARDNLTIPLLQRGILGKFVPQMEMVLNRLKSEFSLARRNYFEYLYPTKEESDLLHENCFTELLNGEKLGNPIEKLRVSFRLCFGILDKIAVAICELYKVKPKKSIYFHTFWQLNEDGRCDKFESIKNPGLLALYSIATDLNKEGEWFCFKKWRNALEHGFLIVTEQTEFRDPYKTINFFENIEVICLNDFQDFLEQLLQLTRSSIFSFVFSVRHLALQNNSTSGVTCKLNRQNYKTQK